MVLKDEVVAVIDKNDPQDETTVETATEEASVDSGSLPVETKNNVDENDNSLDIEVETVENSEESEPAAEAEEPEPEGEPEEEEEDDEPVEQSDEIRESCREKAECIKLQQVLEECNDRVNGRSKTTETCMQEQYDLIHCVDHCVSHTLLSKLK